jgi:trimeric autotransporter adhesin
MLRTVLCTVLIFVGAGEAFAQRCQWEALAGATFPRRLGKVWALEVFDDGMGPALYAGGVFSESLGGPGNRIVRWNGENWAPLGRGVSAPVVALTVFNDGTGPALYVGGGFLRAGEVPDANAIARWDGREWSALGTGMYRLGRYGYTDHVVKALAEFDDGSGPALYAGGGFAEAGGVPALNIARWDGSSWSPVGDGIPGEIRDLAVYDDGSGPVLYAGGALLIAGGVLRWDGVSWSPIGQGAHTTNALRVFDDGTGTGLYAGGLFNSIGGAQADFVARWDGRSWSGLGVGTDNDVRSLHAFNDGTGTALYVGGAFFQAGSIQQTMGIARWDGRDWSAVGSGMYAFPIGPSVDAMTIFDDGSGPALYVGGSFDEAGGIPALDVARWRCETPNCYPDCDLNGTLDFFDFLCFQNAFLAQDPYADCTGDGYFDFFDFLCFQNEFLGGCP